MITKHLVVAFYFLFYSLNLYAQDEIIMRNGDLIKAVVKEIGTDEVKYAKWENNTGPLYSIKKAEIFMINYASGNKDVFADVTSTTLPEEGSPATIYFYRPKKFAGGAPEIIVGTIVPDEVIVKIHNGSWYKTEYTHFGERAFITGVYALNPESFTYAIESGKTYYIRCTLLSKGLKMMSQLEMVDETIAIKEIASLKEQTKNK